MSHYAKVVSGIVTQVIVAEPDFFDTFTDTSPGEWVQTSYNTRKNQHDNGNELRGNYAGIGYVYDRKNDVFYSPKPYPSWTLNTSIWLWEAPVSCPNDGKIYAWNEPSLSWIESTN